jgi:hypothetical protein
VPAFNSCINLNCSTSLSLSSISSIIRLFKSELSTKLRHQFLYLNEVCFLRDVNFKFTVYFILDIVDSLPETVPYTLLGLLKLCNLLFVLNARLLGGFFELSELLLHLEHLLFEELEQLMGTNLRDRVVIFILLYMLILKLIIQIRYLNALIEIKLEGH